MHNFLSIFVSHNCKDISTNFPINNVIMSHINYAVNPLMHVFFINLGIKTETEYFKYLEN